MGCPLEQASQLYVPDEIHPDSELFILLQNPGADEERLGIPAVGKTGKVLNEQFIPLSGLKRGPEISVGNVLRCRYGHTNDLPDEETCDAAAAHCAAAYGKVPDSVQAVIIQGALTLRHADKYTKLVPEIHAGVGTRPGIEGESSAKAMSITDWRGYLLGHRPSHRPSFATVHTADTFRDPAMSWVSNLDWRHIGEYRRSGWANPPPPPQHRAPTDRIPKDAERLFDAADAGHCQYLVVDTEYVPATRDLLVLGLSFRSAGAETSRVQAGRGVGETRKADLPSSHVDIAGSPSPTQDTLAVHCEVLSIDWAGCTPPIRDWYAWRFARAVRRTPCVFHNAHADLKCLNRAFSLGHRDYKQIEDTMLAHAVVWCELPHTLEFLGSIYGKYGKFKHLRDVDLLRYNYGDVIDTGLAWESLSRALALDPQAEAIYRKQSLSLIPLLLEASDQGIRVNTERVLEVFNEASQLIKKVEAFAQLSVGYPINLNSGHQLKAYLYTERGYPLQLNKDTKRATTNDDAIARLRSYVGPLYDTSKDITFDQTDDKHYSLLERVHAGADPILEARALWAGTWQVVNNYIIGLCKGVYGEENKNTRKRARTQYWKAGVEREDIVDRVYPNFAIHAQKTGRWSTTEPPLAQLPSDLRDIVTSDEDEVCISWDWSAIEPRVLQALTGSTLLKKTFDDNFDLHTWTVCYMFGYEFPPDLVDPHRSASSEAWRRKYNWKGKDDPRRVFAKQGRYEMWYGGSGSNAAQAAAQFGLNATDLRVALSKLATSDPAYYSWKIRTETEVKETALIRTFMGRPRRFLSKGDSRRREGLDQPMQGAVADIFNTTAVTLHSQHPYLRWGWGMHDSQKWYCKRSELTPARFEQIKQIVERAYNIAGQETPFPADFSIILPPESGNKEYKPAEYFALAA